MKHILFSLATLLAFQVNATIHTVSNNPSTIAQFNNIQAAADAAVSSDTIYVHGSPNNYIGFAINNKRLVVIGPGWNPDKNLPHVVNVMTAINLAGAGASGSEIQGLSIYAGVSVSTLDVNNIRFVRNRIHRSFINLTPNASGTLSGYLFESNWFDNGIVASNTNYTLQNFLFQNNIFYENGTFTSGNIHGFTNTVNILFDHNLWYGPSTGSRDAFAVNSRFLTIANNVFVRRNAATNLSGSTFNNNITFNAGNDVPWTANSNVDGGGNIAGQDPQLASQAGVNTGTNDPLFDFSIGAGPANNSGTDGKDLGLLYEALGSLNWAASRNSRLPRIYSMNITTPTVVPGGTVNVIVESRRSN